MHFGITRIMKKATKNNKEGKIEIGFTHINKKYTFFKMPQLSWQDTLVFLGGCPPRRQFPDYQWKSEVYKTRRAAFLSLLWVPKPHAEHRSSRDLMAAGVT